MVWLKISLFIFISLNTSVFAVESCNDKGLSLKGEIQQVKRVKGKLKTDYYYRQLGEYITIHSGNFRSLILEGKEHKSVDKMKVEIFKDNFKVNSKVVKFKMNKKMHMTSGLYFSSFINKVEYKYPGRVVLTLSKGKSNYCQFTIKTMGGD